MRIATWNVNSVRARSARIVDWLVRNEVDVLGMQEIKCRPDQFPTEAFRAAGYEVVAHGHNQWNGVALASRVPLEDVRTEFAGMPRFGKPGPDGEPPVEARAIGAVAEGIELWSLYIPNGRSLGDPHYEYKLRWLAAVEAATRDRLAAEPGLALALMGDWNVAPREGDMGDPSFVPGHSTHISAPERAAFQAILDAGLTDVVRPFVPEGFTFWDYKQLRFPRNEGMRIDFILGSPAFADLAVAAAIHRNERKGEAPSDHVPVVIDLDLSLGDPGDEDDRPMIF